MANTKAKNHYYVIVMANDGPAFVTSIEYVGKFAHWKKGEKPLEMSKTQAENLAYGLNLNFHQAYTVYMPYEIETQPYRYSAGEWEWKWKEKEDKE